MSRKTALIKISGDLVGNDKVIEKIRKIAIESFTVIILGGGTQISEAFEQRGFAVDFGPLGRNTETLEQRQLARDVLERNQAETQDLLAEKGIVATVIIPVLDIGSVLCHVNGDVFLLSAYLGFDKLYVFTLKERMEAKRKEFEKYPKIEVIGY